MKSISKILVLVDLVIVTIAFYFLHYIKFNHIKPDGIYLSLYLLTVLFWLLYSVYYQKYTSINFLTLIKNTIWTSAITLFSIVVIVTITPLITVSRLFIIQLIVLTSILNIISIGGLKGIFKVKFESTTSEVDKHVSFKITETKLIWVLSGALMLFLIYMILIKLKTGQMYLYPWSERILIILYGSWFITIFLTKKYTKHENIHNIFYLINPYIKSGLIMLVIATFMFFFFRIESLSRFLLFGTIIAFTILESSYVLLYYLLNYTGSKESKYPIIPESSNTPKWTIEEDSFDDDLTKLESKENLNIKSIFSQIKSLADKPELIEFLDSNLKNININFYSSGIYSTRSIENIEIFKKNSKNVIINLHKLNDVNDINQYLITCHDKLNTEGLIVGYILPIDTQYTRLKNKMPNLIFNIVYPIYFIFNRIIPKIPKIGKLYSMLTNGYNKSISKAEMFGRLNYCGFKIENEKLINSKLYFIAKKSKTVSKVQHPSYHMIVKLNRVGLNGKEIYIYKFRTMYPYSEFLQEYIYNKYDLTDTGNKFQNDFRITNWGKFLRTFWLDELPQLFNWVRGDLNIIGVRALSKQYLSLYPKSHQDYRTKFKPGLIPPFYADLPKSLEDKIISEQNYLINKESKPILTDIKYATKAIINIIFKGARSS